MLSDLLFSRTVTPDLEKSMDAYSLRQRAISDNIANSMTPGYQAKKVSFEEEYKKMLEPQTKMKINSSNPLHISNIKPVSLDTIKPKTELKGDPLNDSGFNNVDIDKEMADMAEVNLRYELSTRLINKRFMNLKTAIRGRG